MPEVSGVSDVLVRVGGAGVCATDLHAIEGLMEPAGVTLPLVLGHENAGWVEAVGTGVTTVAPGDAVLVYPPYSCGLCVAAGAATTCTACATSSPDCRSTAASRTTCSSPSARCSAAGRASSRSRWRRTRTPGSPPTTPSGGSRTSPSPGTTAVVIGVGGVGHIALQLVRELARARSIAIDTDERRRRLATELGADEVLDGPDAVDAVRDLTGGRGADLVFDFVGTDETHAGSARDAGPRRDVLVDRLRRHDLDPVTGLVVNEQAMVGNLVGTWIDLWELLQLHAAGGIGCKTEAHPLDAVNDVLDKLREGEVTGRAVLVP